MKPYQVVVAASADAFETAAQILVADGYILQFFTLEQEFGQLTGVFVSLEMQVEAAVQVAKRAEELS